MKPAPIKGGQGETKKEGQVYKEGNNIGLVLSGHKTNRSLHHPSES